MTKYLLFIFLLASPLFASGGGIGVDANASAVMIGIYAQVETNATTQAEYEDFLGKTSIIVLGDDMDMRRAPPP